MNDHQTTQAPPEVLKMICVLRRMSFTTPEEMQSALRMMCSEKGGRLLAQCQEIIEKAATTREAP